MESSCEFLKFIRSVYGDRFDFLRVRSVTVDIAADSLSVEFVMPYENFNDLSDDDKRGIEALVKSSFPEFGKVVVLFRKNFFSKEAIEQMIRKFIGENYAAMFTVIGADNTRIDVTNDKVEVVFCVTDATARLLEANGFLSGITDMLASNYSQNVSVKTEIADSITINDNAQEEMSSFVVDNKIISYKLGLRVCGGEIKRQPKYISSFKQSEKFVCLAGKISELSSATSKKGKFFYSFTLDDTTAKMKCLYFCRSQDKRPLDVLKDGDTIVASGDLEEDTRGGLTFFVRTVWYCTIDYDSIVLKTEQRQPRPHFELIPKRVEIPTQQNLFEMEEKPASLLENRTYVVLDLETTSLDVTTCRIVEISGVKVVNGEIASYVSTLVDPGIHIPESASEVNHITDDLVAGAPYIDDVLPQFVKWAEGSALVAHNGFFYDFDVLRYRGAELGISFDGFRKLDTLAMAAQWKMTCGVKGNLKLGTLCKDLGIELVNAHRALDDTLATAKLFIKLCGFVDRYRLATDRFVK